MSNDTTSIDKRPSILIVDDESVNLSVFGQCLMTDYAVLVATSGAKALEIANNTSLDLILLDIMMPGMDGYEVIKALKANPKTQDIPVIFVTALTSELDETFGFSLGAADYLYKPCNLSILSVRVNSQIELKKARERLQNQNIHLEAELQKRLQEHQLIQSELMQSEKLAAIGQLAAGIAHEINNPLGFIFSNLNSFQEYALEIFDLIDQYDNQLSKCRPQPDCLSKLQDLKQQKDWNFLREDIADLISESKEGLTRVRNIVRAFNQFTDDNGQDWQQCDIKLSLETTLKVFVCSQHIQCRIRKEYGDTPEIECIPQLMNQVFLSLLTNAWQAVGESGEIIIRTGTDDKQIWVEIADDGPGISPEHLHRLFEPFFTTRPIGKGIGLGLSTANNIVRAHHGRIDVSSQIGEGASFKIWLPIHQTHD
ncbi:response regulator [Methylotuvimicrobium sp. KM2]|uniref:sensor histidine kinase n=1 Tax=Methylotuvimicrobium sp. KM2 TaxID=3133976 RepID=UPI003100C1ED